MEKQEKNQEQAPSPTVPAEARKYPIFLKLDKFVCKIFNRSYYMEYMIEIYEPVNNNNLWECYSCMRIDSERIERMLTEGIYKPATEAEYEEAKKKYLKWHSAG